MTPQPQQKEDVCAEEDFCKGCDNFDGFYNSCKLAQYKTSIQGKTVWIAPRTNGTRWLLKSVGCASDTRTSRPAPSPDVEMLQRLDAHVTKWMKEVHDPETAAKAREKEILTTLDAVRNAKERYEDDDNATIEDALDDIRYHLEGSLIDIQEKTLRIGGEPR